MIVATPTLGDWVGRALKAAQYQLVPAATRRQLESFIASLPGQARWVDNAESVVQAAVERSPRDANIIRLRGLVADLRGTLLTIDRLVRAAAEDARNDGHAIEIANNEVRTLGLPIAPLVVIAVVGAAVVLVATYIVASQSRRAQTEAAIASAMQLRASIEDGIRALAAANRPDLIPDLFPKTPASGVSPWLVLGLGGLVIAGAVGVAYATKGAR